MKTTFKTNELAHIWAHRNAPTGKCTSNMHFDGDVFYSYSTAIARHIRNDQGEVAILVNDTSYSTTTAKHQSYVRRAIPDVLVFRIDGIGRGSQLHVSPRELLDHALAKADKCEQKSIKARERKAELLNSSAYWLEKAVQVARFYGLALDDQAAHIAELREMASGYTVDVKARLATRQEAKKAKQSAAYEAWKASEPYNGSFDRGLFPVAFRVEGDELVSTLGARVPLQAARVAYRFVTSKRGQEWRENGETCPVGAYRLNAINEHGVVAGCHRITWAELERLASILA